MLKNKKLLQVATAILAVVVVVVGYSLFQRDDTTKDVTYNELAELINEGNVEEAKIDLTTSTVSLQEKDSDVWIVGGWPPDGIDDLVRDLEKKEAQVEVVPRSGGGGFPILAFLLLAAIIYFLVSTSKKLGPGGPTARSDNPSDVPTTKFSDVIGCDEAVDELREVTRFLTEPEAFNALGARVPKGFLLVGPPGTGKTLLARACAGEAGVPFYALSASDFVEVFVGMGASRVRKLFAKARKHGKAIIFLDELDSIGKVRGRGGMGSGSTDEHESTLNALLVEMDGFHDSNVVVLAATNRPDVLDPALRRPGRFDRTIFVHAPDRGGRERLLDHYLGGKVTAGVDIDSWARRTPGMTGAEIEAICNDAALEAVRQGKDAIDNSCLDAAVSTAYMGRERRSAVVSERDRRTVAIHEAGHAVVALVTKQARDPVSVTVVPRGPAGGATWMDGNDDQLITTKEAHAQLAVLLAGRASEKVMLGDISQGATDDIAKATELAGAMVRQWGMGTLGPVKVDPTVPLGSLADDASQEERQLVADALTQAEKTISENKGLVKAVADALLERETLEKKDLEEIRATVTQDVNKNRKRKGTRKSASLRHQS